MRSRTANCWVQCNNCVVDTGRRILQTGIPAIKLNGNRTTRKCYIHTELYGKKWTLNWFSVFFFCCCLTFPVENNPAGHTKCRWAFFWAKAKVFKSISHYERFFLSDSRQNFSKASSISGSISSSSSVSNLQNRNMCDLTHVITDHLVQPVCRFVMETAALATGILDRWKIMVITL